MSEATIECGVVLHPAGHTRSPAMHNAAFSALGLHATYSAFDVPPEALEQAMVDFRKRGIRQLAVSIPHKESIMEWVDEVEPVGLEIGAINTVTRVGERLVGTNTDWLGVLHALEREGPVDGQPAVVLGAGGTARAAVYALRQRGCEVSVLNRTVGRAETIARDLGAASAGPLEALAGLEPAILVNTTSVGLNEMRSPVATESLPTDAVVLDVVYSAEQTQLLIDAKARGNRAIGGKWMLVHQAVEQLRIWTRRLEKPPGEADLARVVDVMADAFDRAGQVDG
jgi:shikimate dehydrogenase